jgi:AcrR family transcriptional regulator
MGRVRRSKKDLSSPHPTAVALLDATVELLDHMPLDEVSVAAVIERSGISHGSLYHHYEDFSDLVEQAIIHRYVRRIQVSVRALDELLECADAAEYAKAAEAVFIENVSPARRPNRADRAEVLGALKNRPRLVGHVARAQGEITDGISAHYAEAQRRGWIRPDVDPTALAAFMQGMAFGRIIDDVCEPPVAPERWNEVALIAFRATMFSD